MERYYGRGTLQDRVELFVEMIMMYEAVPILKAQGYLIALTMTRISFKFQVTIFLMKDLLE